MDWRRIFLKLVQMVVFQLQVQKVRVMKAPGPSGAMKQILLNLAPLLKIGDLEELQTELGGIIQQRNLIEALRASKETAKTHQGRRDTYEASQSSEGGWTQISGSKPKNSSGGFQPSPWATAKDDGTFAKPTKEKVWLPGEEPPTCLCGEPCIYEITKKDNPNKYRLFWGCQTSKCKFFQWLQERPAWNGKSQDAAG